jgi:hypothetical protein
MEGAVLVISLQIVKLLTELLWCVTKEAEASDLKIGAVQNWFKSQPKNVLCDGIKEILKRWNRCVEVEGDYVEKWY